MSLLPLSNASLDSVQPRCANTDGSLIGISLITTRILLLFPVSVFILCHGLQQRWQWRQRRSFKARSHFDVFTYHQCVLELIWILGFALQSLGSEMGNQQMVTAGIYLTTSIFPGETLFHVLTCVDRYLAVVHLVTYHSLRNTHGVTIRNIAVFGDWLLSSLLSCAANNLSSDLYMTLFYCFLAFSLVLISFCNFSFLCALIGPGPRKRGGNKRHVDQTTQRAFITVTAINLMLCLWFFGFLVSTSLLRSKLLMESVSCILEISVLWFSLPNSLILPLLYLLKTVKLPCGHHDSNSGQQMSTKIN